MIVDIDEVKALRAENERLRAEAKASPVPVLLAEIKRLRAIELAAREYFNASRTGTFVDSHDAWRKLEAALAAKDNK